MGGLQHQSSCFLFYLFIIQFLMVSALWNDDDASSNWFTDSATPPGSFKKRYPFSQDRNPCHANYYSEKCRIFRKLFYGSQTVNDVFDEKDRLQWEREKKLSKISVNLNAHSCPCEYNTTYIDLGDNDYFPSKISKINCGFTKNVEKCQKHGWCQKKEWVIDVLKRQTAPSSAYTGSRRINVIPNDLTDIWEIESVKTTVACTWVPK